MHKRTKEQYQRDQAIIAIKNYLTKAQFIELQTTAMELTKYNHLEFYCFMLGIHGYVVKELWNETRQTMRDMTS